MTTSVDGCKDVFSRMTVIDVSSSMTRILDARERVINLGMLIVVDGCKDVSSISSRMIVIDDELWLKYSLRRCVDACNDTTGVDSQIWRKYSLRRCLRM